MPVKITSLTQEQRDQMKPWAEKWIAEGLRTDRCDREAFKKGIDECYAIASLKPVPIIWVSSPMAGAFAAPIASQLIAYLKNSAVDSAVGSEVGSEVRSVVDSEVRSAVDSEVDSAVYSAVYSAVGSAVDSVVGSEVDSVVRSEVGSAVYSEVGSDVGSVVRSEVYSEVYSAVDSAVYSAVYSEVGSAVGSAVYSEVYSEVRSAVRKLFKPSFYHYWIGGQFWAAWDAYISYFLEICQWQPEGDIKTRALAYKESKVNSCYYWPNKHFVMVCDRPLHIHLDDQGRLHSSNDLAIKWEDGWGIAMIHGVKVPNKAVLAPETLTLDETLSEQNAEVRRILTEIYGIDRYIEQSNAELVHFDQIPVTRGSDRMMPRALIKDQFNDYYLEGWDSSTTRVYFMLVWHPEVIDFAPPKTCKEAHELISGCEETKCLAQS